MSKKNVVRVDHSEDYLATQEEKDQKIEIAKKAILKKYGNVISNMGADKELFIPTISSGSLGLDLALGRGGFARGRVYECYGAPSSGKCVSKNNYLHTEHGLLTVEELFALYEDPVYCASKEREHKCGLRNENSDIEYTSHFVWSGRHKVKKITTAAGFETESTYKHRYRVIDKTTGFIVWKRTEDIDVDDYVLISNKGIDVVKNDLISEDEATFLGMLVAEGSLGQKTGVGFTNSDKEINILFSTLCKDLFNIDDIKHYNKNVSGNINIEDVEGTIETRIHSKDFRTYLYSTYGLDYTNAIGKSVPIKVRCSSNKVIAKFLSAYLSLDGCLELDGNITASSASKQLLSQIQLLLLNSFGIKSTVAAKLNNVYNRYYYHLYIAGEDTITFMEQIGFIIKSKVDRFLELNNNYNKALHETSRWNFPFQSGLIKVLCADSEGSRLSSRSVGKSMSGEENKLSLFRLNEILNVFKDVTTGPSAKLILSHLNLLSNYVCDKVASVEDIGDMPVFDVVMPETHSFVTNGFISHNTTLAMSVIAQAQKRGLTACFCDAEHAADPKLFKAMGVDVDNLIKIKAYSGEDNLDSLETLIKTGTIDVAVVDSVSALIPKAESEAAIDDDFIGLLARLMSKTMRRFVPIISETNTLMIFINQLRTKIGSWGDPMTTTGGEALNFYATGRISVAGGEFKKSRIIDSITGEVIGHETTFSIQKNKLAPPWRSAKIPLIYGVGYNLFKETLDLAVSLAVIEKSGAYFYFNGEKFAQGDDNAVQHLKDNSELYTEIYNKIIDITGLKEHYERNNAS